MRRVIAVAMLAGLLGVGVAVAPPAHAASTDAEVAQLSAQLEHLDADPELGRYAIAQRTLARNAIAELRDAGRSERDHALFMAEQRVALAKAAAQVEAARARLDQLQRRHDQIALEASQAEAAAARAELARQRLQYQAAVEQAQMLQEQGAQATLQAQQEAEQAKKLAAAQARAAALARKEAKLAEAARALQQGSGSQSAGKLSLTGLSFQDDSADLTSAGRRRVADFAHAHADQRIVIEPSASSDSRVLAGRRAVSVRDALAAGGADKVSIGSVGHADSGTRIVIRTRQ